MALNNLTRIRNSGFGTDTSINTTGIVTAGNSIQTYNNGSETPITNSDDWIAQVRGL